ncbi:MAG: phosphoribosyl-AMP cyclohydrolase [Gemmatimonadaceae bacterium]|nr:phosphoribosyl-AMP cyclohydrolase [Gemmatimonadaceae bacterium]
MSESLGGMRIANEAALDRLNFTKGNGLVTVVAQDHVSGVVLMVAHADRDALARTLATGEMHYTSRTRGLWHKGGTSGNVQRVVSLTSDCDGDAVLARVRPAGPACHEGTTSCFRDDAVAADALGALDATLAARAETLEAALVAAGDAKPASWTHRLLADRNLRHKKLGEEAVELTMACLDGDVERIAEEGADLVYHTLVAMRAAGVGLDALRRVLDARVR